MKPRRVEATKPPRVEERGAQGRGEAGAGAQAGRQGGRGGGRGGDRVNWDAPYIISPHSPRRLYWASNFVYRTDDRGDSWTRISPDLSRNLNRDEIPIMGKLWPADSIARNTSTTPLSNVVTIDESPLLEGLLYVGTDDGLIQVTEDGGKNWRKVEQFPGVPQWTYVTDVFASPREADTVFATLNNWQRGDYKPYVVKSADRGKTWTNITGNLPAKHDAWSIVQDHVNANLLFVGTEFALFASIDGGKQWTQLKGGLPPAQIRDMTVQKRENDLVLATFGRGFYVLDDYSALRDLSPAALAEDAKLFPLRDAYLYNLLGLSPAGSAGLSSALGTVARGESPVRRGVHVSRAPGSSGGREARADDQRRHGQADSQARSREDRGAAARRLEPARGAAGCSTGRSGGTRGRRRARRTRRQSRAARRARPLSRHPRQDVRRHRDADRIAAAVRSGTDRAVGPGVRIRSLGSDPCSGVPLRRVAPGAGDPAWGCS